MNQARKRTGTKKVLSMILVLVMLLSLLSMAAFTLPVSETGNSKDAYEYNIMFLDCGRKYFSVNSIEKIIDNASAAGFNYIQLAVGNDGLRFLLDDMSLTVNGTTYTSKQVSDAIHTGNTDYNAIFSKRGNEAKDSGELRPYDPTTNELTQSEMNKIIAYAKTKGMGVIPCVNTPGHMDAILSAANSLTGTNCSYNGSVRTIDVTNGTAVAFTKALLQKYIDYFAGQGCKLFNMGADEYANDKYGSGSMGFGNLQESGNYRHYVNYVNDVAEMIKDAGMKPMAFNDGIYFDNNTSSGKFDTDIIICYWSSGWSGYSPMSASKLASMGFRLVNTNGSYYWVLGKNDKCSASKASSFNKNSFPDKDSYSGNSTISNPAGSMFCIWSDYPGAESEADVISKTEATIRYFGAALPKVTTGTVTPTPTTPTPDTNAANNEYTISVGSSKTITVSGNYAGNYQMNPETVAAVTTEHQQSAASSISYSATASASIEAYSPASNVIDGNTSTKYWSYGNQTQGAYVQVDLGAAIPFDTVRLTSPVDNGDNCENAKVLVSADSSAWTEIGRYTGNITPTSFTNTLDKVRYIKVEITTAKNYWWQLSEIEWGNTVNGSFTRMPTSGTVTTEAKDETAITFTGLSVGDATVDIGGVTYTIHVIPEDLSKVTPLTIEYWITNGPVLKDKNSSTTAVSVSVTKEIATETGVSVAALVPGSGIKASEKNEDNPHTLEYWQAKLLNKSKPNNSSNGTEEQTAQDGDDETLSGSAFTKVRYWGGTWQVYTTEWVTVESTDQLVAYYMEVINIKNKNGVENLHVNAADWGVKGDGSTALGYNPGDTCSVSVQLVYEDGSTSPSATTPAELNSKTIVYSYWNGGRGLGTMVFNGKDNYQIFKVTAETGDMSSKTDSVYTGSGYTYAVTVNSFTWDNNEETVWEGTATDSVSIGNPVKNPSYDAPYDNLAWNTSEHNNNNAILIRVYVKSIPKAGALTVNYFVDGNADPFYHYGINVVENTTFDAGFQRVEDADAPGKAKLTHNSVTNYDGETQEVQSDLSKMTEIGAQYRYSDYTFVRATRSEDGKTVNLYYTFKAEKTFVIDFGLPLVIRPVDVKSGFEGVTITKVDITNQSTYANIAVDGSGNITYTLKQPIDGADTFGVRYYGYRGTGSGDSVSYTITIIPATSVYYEDSFATFTDGTGKASEAEWSIVGNDGKETADKSTSQNQTLTELSKMSPDDVYGHDTAYDTSTKLSMGSAHKVTVTSDMYVSGDTTTTWPSATFTFKGTGFDVISLTSSTSGSVVCTVTGKNTGTSKTQLVDTYYGYKQVGDQWVVDKNSNSTLYQIPVIKVTGLPYDEYTVTLSVRYGEFFDHKDAGEYSFWLDAIRVYDPMGKDNATYTKDGEGYPQYIMLRDQLAEENGSVKPNNNLLFIDGADKAAIATYANYGPNNEVYLANGQAITFTVQKNDKIASIQIGAKAPDGSNAAMMNVNGTDTNITSATEMYYQIGTAGGSFTITNTGTGILSLTNLKITFTDKPGSTIALTAPTAEEQTAAVMSVRALFAAPEQTFEPKYFTAKWSRNVRKGGTATLTVKASADVEAITVNGKEITAHTTKTARSVWGAKETYHVFTYRVENAVTADYSICAVNGEGAVSDPITATLTVRPSIRDWWNGIFDKWKH